MLQLAVPAVPGPSGSITAFYIKLLFFLQGLMQMYICRNLVTSVININIICHNLIQRPGGFLQESLVRAALKFVEYCQCVSGGFCHRAYSVYFIQD